MKTGDYQVNKENYYPIYRRIEIMIDEFQLNVEKWWIEKFKEIPDVPGHDSITALQMWIDSALSENVRDSLLRAEALPILQKHTLVLTAEIYEQLESLRKLYGLKDSNQAVETLLDYYKEQSAPLGSDKRPGRGSGLEG